MSLNKMSNELFEQLTTALDMPVYVFTKSVTGYLCDKLTLEDEETKEFDRKRYVLTKNSCTCMSFMKGNKCKHLRMLGNDYDWIGDPVGPETAMGEALRLTEMFENIFPESVGQWKLDLDKVPMSVNVIKLNICDHYPKELKLLVSVKRFPETHQSLAVQFSFEPKKEE